MKKSLYNFLLVVAFIFVANNVYAISDIEIVSINNDRVQGDETSLFSSISADGRFVAFESIATNLVSNDTNVEVDIFVYDRQEDKIERISVGYNGN